jgi:glycerophosphoryl diester phosphodiesterase
MNAWLRDGPPLIVAHRGASAGAPENTLAAFRLAAAQGADGIEFDVRRTADGHLVVIHDASLGRTTDRDGEITALTLEEIRRADAGARRSPAFRGEGVPTFEEVLTLARARRLLVDVELKVPGIEPLVAVQLARAEMTEAALVTSFLEETLVAMRRADRNVVIGLLQQVPDVSRAVDLGAAAYLPHVGALSAALMQVCRTHGLRVIPWTIRRDDEARGALRHEVDGLIADDPLLVRRVLENL